MRKERPTTRTTAIGKAGPSTPLRSGRDDKFVEDQYVGREEIFVIPAGAHPDFLPRGSDSPQRMRLSLRKAVCRGSGVEEPATGHTY